MGNSCTDTLERVRDLFDGRFALDDSGDSCLITTPYLRHDNDFIVLRLRTIRAGTSSLPMPARPSITSE